MQCDICGNKEVKVRRVTRSYGKAQNLLIIENIPVISCLSCGESYLTAETLHEIDRIKRNRNNLAKPKTVEVANF
jgi:YgiT-type zinc finger domain-containing protein